MTLAAACPECDGSIVFKAIPTLDQKVRCPHCRTDLIVIETQPIELDWDDFEDDWEDDDGDDSDS